MDLARWIVMSGLAFQQRETNELFEPRLSQIKLSELPFDLSSDHVSSLEEQFFRLPAAKAKDG